MANEIRAKYDTGKTLYAILIRGSDGLVWNGAAFESLNAANWANYVLTMTEQSTTGIYYGSMPAVNNGLYDVWIYYREGGSPVPADPLSGQASLDWNGSSDVGLSTINIGDGSIQVDHNYGGTDTLTYRTSGGAGIDNATVRCYLTSDYNNGNTGRSYLQGETMTDVNGRWQSAFFLDPADYTLIFFRQYQFGPDRVDITVS